MYLSIHAIFQEQRKKRGRVVPDVLDLLLNGFAKDLQADFCCFADGGAGIGATTKQYHNILTSQINSSLIDKINVVAYEPLPENFTVLQELYRDIPGYRLRNVALANDSTFTKFVVPSRLTTNVGSWREGTSYNGFLGGNPHSDCIDVQTVRLFDEIDGVFDFVKLDLQGGEYDALLGLGDKIEKVKLFYIEHQLLREEQTLQMLVERNFGIFFDRIQFGLRPDVEMLALRELETLGVVVEKLWNPGRGGIGMVLWGYFDQVNGLINPNSLSLYPGVADELRKLGISYMQTDAIGIHHQYLGMGFDILSRA